ncbi:hypothetical protein [Stackebrandtia nassauensis]|uniref:Uncharacterized protein n=1 Tax=Stackebrandtia nassauensis (strain DSM 44728 / CIP 108903 / NRRL B-16338 / NBRC 102104 / LLR-40K-21) TaxID=446470 RepID=D3Q312_STANL|nr:hypothetical protein [Stackebrandtia nassauensis]ADD39982.1 hypothetical protein Snas_0264 [Stackebrandtia nassauensis DSM 44728]
MAKEVQADFVELGVLGKAFTTAGTGLRTGLKDMREEGLIPANAFGNTPGAEGFNESYSDVLEKAGQAMEDLADTVERDSDNVYRVAFAYQKTDLDNKAKIDANTEKEKLDRLREEVGSVPYPSKPTIV